LRNLFALGALCLGVAASVSDYTQTDIVELANEAGLDPAALLQDGDPEYGEYLSGECTTCHKQSEDFDGMPVIIQWDETEFRLALHEYRLKTRDHPVMQMIAGRLSDEEIAALSAYFADVEQ
jgi:cytochrome c